MSGPLRRLVLVLGDQLWWGNPALKGFDPACDRVLMIEAPGEATAAWSHKARIALFLSAMRHFCNEVHRRRWPYTYVRLDAEGEPATLQERLQRQLQSLQPEALAVCEPGEWRVLQAVRAAAGLQDVPLTVCEDTHFMCSTAQFERWARARPELRMEFFYRDMRRRHGILMNGREPEGGQWNYDADNRKGYPSQGPGDIPPPAWFEPDRITRDVFVLVQRRFGDHPGSLEHFRWPVTREQALLALERFIDARLPGFGTHQDAMWTDTPWGWHALLATSLNLHLLDPREVIAAAQAAWRDKGLRLASVEGFIRQILGWREFTRGVYWLDMPGLRDANHFGHGRALPRWYWTGDTRMACMRDVIGQTLAHGHAHHIQRLMVTGQFALLAEVDPRAVCDWYQGVYVDAVEWVQLPNTAGMALYANGGRFTSKPYIASGQYMRRMSNYCSGCAYRPDQRFGEGACPMTALYWNFLDKHQHELAANPRTALMARQVTRLSPAERESIRRHAAYVLEKLDDL